MWRQSPASNADGTRTFDVFLLLSPHQGFTRQHGRPNLTAVVLLIVVQLANPRCGLTERPLFSRKQTADVLAKLIANLNCTYVQLNTPHPSGATRMRESSCIISADSVRADTMSSDERYALIDPNDYQTALNPTRSAGVVRWLDSSTRSSYLATASA